MSAVDILRDALFGNPPSPATKPSREGVLVAFSELAQTISIMLGGIVAEATPAVHPTRAELFGDLAFPDRALGLVYADGQSNYNGIYVKSGAVGQGSWLFTGLLGTGPRGVTGRGPTPEEIAAAVKLYVDALDAKVNQASTAAAASAGSAADSAESADAAEGARESVQAALAGFPFGATLTAPIASRDVLAGVIAVDGNTAYLTEKGREGEFVFSTDNLATKVAADPRQGVYVAPRNDTTGASGAWVRRYEPGEVSAAWWGVKADGVEKADGTCTGTDDTAAIQAAWDFASATGQKVQHAAGIHVIAGAPKGEGNCQLTWPMGGDQSNQRVLHVKGAAGQSTTWTTINGTILRSTWNGVGDWQCLGGKTPSRGGPFEPHNHAVWASIYIEDLTVRLNENPKGSGIDFSYIPMFRTSNVRVDVPSLSEQVPGTNFLGYFTAAEPTTTMSYAIKGAVNDLPLRGLTYNTLVAGFHKGYRLSELFGGNDLTALACRYPIEVPDMRHGGAIPYILVCTCPTTMLVTAKEPAEINIGYLDIEHSPAQGSGPIWGEPRGSDIIDPNFMLHGTAILHMHDGNFPFTVNGKADGLHPNFRIRKGFTAYNSEYPAPEMFPGFLGGDHAIHVVRRGLPSAPGAARLAWSVLETIQPNIGDLIGGFTFINEAIPDGNNKRVAMMYALLEDAINSGSLAFGTSKNGLFAPKWLMNADGDLVALLRGSHFTQAEANSDRAGFVTANNQVITTKKFDRPYKNPPVVIVTAAADVPADAVIRTASFADRVEIRSVKADGSAYSISGTFSYWIVGNPD